MKYLPDEIWYMICTLLSHRRDLAALFNCACSGKRLAPIALITLYRVRELAPDADCCINEEHDLLSKMKSVTRLAHERRIFGSELSSQERYVKKWARLWRTIILSSLGKTLYPYYQCLRTLDLRDLEELLTDYYFGARTRQEFFQGELEQFKIEKDEEFRRGCSVQVVEIINRVGEAITKQTPPLEELTGKVRSGELSRWIPRLPRLTRLKLWNGAAIAGNGNLIRLHCPSFKKLAFLIWDGTNSDQDLADFLNELRPQSLESFETMKCPDSLDSFETTSYARIGPQSFQALSCHGKSLIELKIIMLATDAGPQVSRLKCCTNLVSLSLAGGSGGLPEWVHWDLEGKHHDDFLETLAWLKECKKLRVLAFANFPSAAALMAPILLENSIHLTSLEYVGARFPHYEEFLQALANQTSLQFLCLKDTSEKDPEGNDVLVETLSGLVNLTDLHVREVSDTFTDLQLVRLAYSLPKLEVWSTRVHELTEDLWDAVASLKSLRRLEVDAITYVEAYRILNFIEKLGPGNNGLVLDLRNSRDSVIKHEQKEIREEIAKKVGGKFKFTYNKYLKLDPWWSPFDSSSEYVVKDFFSIREW